MCFSTMGFKRRLAQLAACGAAVFGAVDAHAQSSATPPNDDPSSRNAGDGRGKTQGLRGDPRFAAALFQEHDYFRAVGEYKALAFYAEGAAKTTYTLAIAEAYRRSDRPRSSIPVAARLLASPEGAVRDRASLFLTANFFALRSRALAEPYLVASRRADPFLASSYAFLGALDGGDLDEASRELTVVSKVAPLDRRIQVAGWAATLDRVQQASLRSPALAGVFSAVVPGAGQLYAGHPVDALQALFFVGAFATATFASYRYEHDRQGPYPLTITTATLTSIFYVANVYGAVRAAHAQNKRLREDKLAPLRSEVLDLPLWEPETR